MHRMFIYGLIFVSLIACDTRGKGVAVAEPKWLAPSSKPLFPSAVIKLSQNTWHEYLTFAVAPLMVTQQDESAKKMHWNPDSSESHLALGLFVDMVENSVNNGKSFNLSFQGTSEDQYFYSKTEFSHSPEFEDDSRKIYFHFADQSIEVGRFRKPQRHRELETWLHPQICEGAAEKKCTLSFLVFGDTREPSGYRFECLITFHNLGQSFALTSQTLAEASIAEPFRHLLPAPGDLCTKSRIVDTSCAELPKGSWFALMMNEKPRFRCQC